MVKVKCQMAVKNNLTNTFYDLFGLIFMSPDSLLKKSGVDMANFDSILSGAF